MKKEDKTPYELRKELIVLFWEIMKELGVIKFLDWLVDKLEGAAND